LDTTPVAVIARLGRARALVDERLNDFFAEYGLSRQSWDLMACLRRVGKPYELTPTELTEAMMRTSGTITHTLHALEHRRLVKRVPSSGDGRSVPVRLTGEGRKLVDRLAPLHVENERAILGGLKPDQQTMLADLLRTLLIPLEAARLPERERRRTRHFRS
jgi:DNA-binding MarR family transcriptional regulator